MVNLYFKVLIFAVLIAILDRYVISDPEDVTLKESIPQVNLDMRQGSVLTDDGRLAHVGYQTQPWLKWNPSVLTSSFARKMRFKQWEFYALYSEDVTLCVAAADIGYAKNVFITIYEKGKDPVTIEEIIPPWIDANMTTSSLTGTTRFNTTDFFLFFFNNGSDMKSIVTQYKQGQIDINMMFVKAKSQDGLVYLGPMSKDKSHFFYSHKQYNYIVDGYLKINGKTHLFSKEQGVMDWGRGVWPYHSRWIWGSALGVFKNTYYGLNIGELQGTDLEATDDCLFVNETLVKIGVVNVQRPNNPLAPWEFTTVNEKPTSSYASIKINFYPEKSFEKSFNAWIIKSDLKQYFGTYKGIVTTNEHVFEVELRGILEDHHSRW